MPNSPPPPTYEEAVLGSVDPHLRQNHANHKKDHPPSRQAADNTATEPPKLVVSAVISPYPSATCPHEASPSQSCVLDLSHTPIEVNFTTESDGRNYMNTPAIIIHSAISTPGDDECRYFDKFTSSGKNSPVNEQEATHNEKHNKAPIYPVNIQEKGNSTKVDIELKIADRIKKDNNGGDISYQTITKDHSSIIYADEVTDWKRGTTEPCVECRKANGFERRRSAASDYAKARKVAGEIMCISNGGTAQPRFYSHDSLVRKHHQQDIAPNNEISNSIDEDWPQMNRICADGFSFSPSMRQRSGTLDGTSVPFKQNLKQCSEDRRSTLVLIPTRSNFSKSYNDLSNRQQVMYHRDSFCGRNMYKCPQCCSTSTRDCRCRRASKSHKQNNLYNGRVNHRSVEENRISKHHLFPEARNGPCARGMRSASVDDVRMRGGTDEYEWKDGKVQIKNGKISHGESVRYVWKDGHVEKITSDFNNEDTQVEILEASDSKTCSKINPVFVCIFLLAVIAIVIIIPVYFYS